VPGRRGTFVNGSSSGSGGVHEPPSFLRDS